MSYSDSDEGTETLYNRLGECEVCGDKEAIYTCPKCEVKTCGLSCVVIHKKELKCDGIRDRTKFIRMKDFSDTDLLSDYRLLEECARFTYGVKRDPKKRFTRIDKDLPIHLFKLKAAARSRGTVLQYLSQNFTRHSINTTRYHYKLNKIFWRIEWFFPNAEPDLVKFCDDKCCEDRKLSELIDKYINPDAIPFEGSKALTYYKAAGARGVSVLLKAEKIPGSARKYFQLDPGETLAENLSGKCIVEFPIIFIVLKDHAYNFDIVIPEEEFIIEENINKEKIENEVSKVNEFEKVSEVKKNEINKRENEFNYKHSKRPRELLTVKIAKEKDLEIQKEIKQEIRKKPKNLLFTTGYSSEENMDSDSDKEEK